jgi:hypothetical protein
MARGAGRSGPRWSGRRGLEPAPFEAEALGYFFRINPISRAIRFTDPACRPSAVAISDATTPRRIITESFSRSPSVHSFGLDDFILRSSSRPDMGGIGRFAGAAFDVSSRTRVRSTQGTLSASDRRTQVRAALCGTGGGERAAQGRGDVCASTPRTIEERRPNAP